MIQSVHSPTAGSLWSARAALTLQAVRSFGCLGCNGLLKGAFQHQVNRNYRPKALGSGLRGGGNAFVENGKKRNDPTDKAELWRCVWDVQCRGDPYSSGDAYRYRENSLVLQQLIN